MKTKVAAKKELGLIAFARLKAALDGVCGTIWAQRERSCKVQTNCRVLSTEGNAVVCHCPVRSIMSVWVNYLPK